MRKGAIGVVLSAALWGCLSGWTAGGAGVEAQAPAGVAGGGAAPAAQAGGPGRGWVSGYYVGYQRDMYKPAEIDWGGLTHIVMGRLKANADATLATDFDIDPVNGPALARDIAQRAHAAGRRAILMLGGAGQGAAILSSSSAARRGPFVKNLVKAMNDYGYDGLDLDWEDKVDLDLFLDLVRDLRAAAPGAILTVPGAALNANLHPRVDPRIVRLAGLVDQYNLMTYYPGTAYAGVGWLSWHNSPLKGAKSTTPVAIDDSLRRYVSAGVPRARLGMGIAFYAVCYTGSVTGPNQPTWIGVDIRGGDNEYPLSELFGAGGAFSAAARRWDGAAECSYLSLTTPERHGCRYVSFEDEPSIAAKGRFARENGYGGIIVWTLNQGYVRTRAAGQPNFLMQALAKAFIQ